MKSIEPPDEVQKAIIRILEECWDRLLLDFVRCLDEQPDQCHTNHLFVACVDVVAWLSGTAVWPMDFVMFESDFREAINLASEKFSPGR